MIIFQLECSPKLTYATAPTVLQESKQKKSKTNAANVCTSDHGALALLSRCGPL